MSSFTKSEETPSQETPTMDEEQTVIYFSNMGYALEVMRTAVPWDRAISIDEPTYMPITETDEGVVVEAIIRVQYLASNDEGQPQE